MSASIGNGRSFRSSWFCRQARWTNSLSVRHAETTASRSANSPFSLPKAAISVGQTKVKSFGQKKTTFHLPASDSSVISVKAFVGSVETTALRSKLGNLSPMVSMVQELPNGRGAGRLWDCLT